MLELVIYFILDQEKKIGKKFSELVKAGPDKTKPDNINFGFDKSESDILMF